MKQKNSFEEFCSIAKIDKQKSKIDTVILFMYYHIAIVENLTITTSKINNYFEKAHLPLYNSTYLKKDLSKDKRTIRNTKDDTYKLSYSTFENLDKQFSHLKDKDIEIKVRVNLNSTPFLDDNDLNGAQIMSQLYIILHCWENSVRKFIAQILYKEIGTNWWDSTKNNDLEKKINERSTKEKKQKWISPRGTQNPLYYLDWGDLVKIIRKHEMIFNCYIPDIKFVELRLEELERLRNIIAHNGLVPDNNDIDRIIVHFKDWSNQLRELKDNSFN